MSTLLAVWLVGVLVFSVPFARFAAVTPGWTGQCRAGRFDGARGMVGHRTWPLVTCRNWHGRGCWENTGEVGVTAMAVGLLLGACWPLLVPFVALMRTASLRPTSLALTRRVAALEAELAAADAQLDADLAAARRLTKETP